MAFFLSRRCISCDFFTTIEKKDTGWLVVFLETADKTRFSTTNIYTTEIYPVSCHIFADAVGIQVETEADLLPFARITENTCHGERPPENCPTNFPGEVLRGADRSYSH